jgi:nicotinate-nucleotide adenylyltransferase
VGVARRTRQEQGRLGVFGGTFDPVHVGHLGAVRAVQESLGLDLVLFVPATRPRLRAASPAASIDDRVAMVRLAIQELPWAGLSMVDAVRPGPAYSVDTLHDLQEANPGANLFLIVGSGSLPTLTDWKDARRLVTMATLVCVGRPGGTRPDELPERHPGRHALYVEGPMIPVSATEVRRRLAEGASIEAMVPGAVVRYIEDHRLYVARHREAAQIPLSRKPAAGKRVARRAGGRRKG